MNYFNGTCMMCLKKKTVRNIALYIVGSEGLDICSICDLEIREFIAGKRSKASCEKLKSFQGRKNNG